MTTKEAITAAIEAKELASNVWLQSYQAVQETYKQYLLADDLGIDQSEAANRYLVVRKIERKASRAFDKAVKLCKFLGVSE